MAKVTGIGGIFFKAKHDHKALALWYQTHLGITLEPFGAAILRWTEDKSEDKGITVWSTAAPDTKWFSPGDAPFMVNYRVDDLDGLLSQLKAANIPILQGPEYHENGSFAWISDPDGNKIELWEPKPWDEKNKR